MACLAYRWGRNERVALPRTPGEEENMNVRYAGGSRKHGSALSKIVIGPQHETLLSGRPLSPIDHGEYLTEGKSRKKSPKNPTSAIGSIESETLSRAFSYLDSGFGKQFTGQLRIERGRHRQDRQIFGANAAVLP